MSTRLTFVLVLVGTLALAAPLAVSGAQGPMGKVVKTKDAGLVEVGGDYNNGRPLPVRGLKEALRAEGPAARVNRAQAEAGVAPDVGTVQEWIAIDDLVGVAYLKEFTLRGVGENVEVWVASELGVDVDEDGPLPSADGLDFPEGDCRNGVRTQITDEQVAYLIDEFDTNIYPKESATFSVPPPRDGTGEGLLGPELLRPGDGENIVVLIDNVRDANFYDTDNSEGLAYIAGFFFSFTNEVHDRNVMSVDAFDWLHRTGANPPNEPSEDLCTNAPARPFLYEGTFAHEYQHLLQYYEDGDETTWMSEGLADWAQTLTGYVDPSLPITDTGFDSHIQCFLGYLGIQTDANPIPRDGGPENSLTAWGDQNFDHEWEILCDYGAAYTLMELLAGRYGTDFMSFLHRDEANGLAGLNAALDAFGRRPSARRILRQWAAAVALDGVLDRGAELRAGHDRRYKVPTLDATINWDSPESYETPGAPPNGSDYVRLRDDSSNYLTGRDLQSISFDGASTLPAKPVEWTVDSDPPDHAGDPALYSGSGDSLDRAIVREVTFGATPSLAFETLVDTEDTWDYGFVQVSTDRGATYHSVACDGMNSEPDPGTIPTVHENLPGYSGQIPWTGVTSDVSAYAGQTVLLSFRYVTDSAFAFPGWWVDDVTVDGAVVSDGGTLEGWQSATQVKPIDVARFTVQIVAWETQGANPRASISRLRLDKNHDGSWSRSSGEEESDLHGVIVRRADHVGAIVMYDDPTEAITDYAPYVLQVNGVTQPGGS